MDKSLFLTAAALVASSAPLTAADPPKDSRLFELRIYHAAPGKLDALHARFRDHTVALFEKHGMEQLGYFVPLQNNESNTLVYWLAYPDEGARDNAWKGFLGDPVWKEAHADSIKDGEILAKVESFLLRATDYSPPVGKLVNKGDTRVFEWRTYTTNEGKLPNINARFRDRTCDLFKKHGMTNLPYWTYAEGTEGAAVTLTYLLAHADQKSRDASFKAFSEDPTWQAVRDASEKEGKILIKDGVRSVMLKPTDYSPTSG